MMLVFAIHKDGSWYYCFRAPINFDIQQWVESRSADARRLIGVTGYYAEIIE